MPKSPAGLSLSLRLCVEFTGTSLVSSVFFPRPVQDCTLVHLGIKLTFHKHAVVCQGLLNTNIKPNLLPLLSPLEEGGL